MKLSAAILTLLMAISLPGCASGPGPTRSGLDDRPTPADPSASTTAAYINGKPLSRDELYAIMASQLGGEALAEVVLGRAIEAQLMERGLTLSPQDLDAERRYVRLGLSSDPDQAVLLLRQMRQRRGLTDARFDALLRRNAGLRKMVADQIEVGDAAVGQAYQSAYGPRYRVRLLVTQTLETARLARARANRGSPFGELATELSTDSSRAQGGLLSPISPTDTSYPQAIRDALSDLNVESDRSRLSPILAIDSGFALLYLEELIPGQDIAFATVEADLRRGVRLQLERVRMQQLARSMLEGANVVVLDPLLEPGWARQKEAVLRGGGVE